MSAKVVPGIPASEYMDIDYLEDAPQVHLHFLTGPDEYRDLGYGRVELCCHGCGAAVLVLFNLSAEGEGRASHQQVSDAFAKVHAGCANRHFERACPAYRSSMKVADLRTRQRRMLPEPDPAPPPRAARPKAKKPAAA